MDDFFGGAPTALADSNSAQRICCVGDRAESIEIAKEVFARLVRACLGSSAISSRKLEHGSTLVILGIEIQLDAEGATYRPSPEKLERQGVANAGVTLFVQITRNVPFGDSHYSRHYLPAKRPN